MLNSVGVVGVAAADGFDNGSSAYSVGANVDWTPVTNFLVRAQVSYFAADNGAAALNSGDRINTRLRFQRSF